MTVSSKVRIYDLAKELKLDTKRLIEEVRREGVDVSVPSNSVSKELAEKIRNKYFPKKETAVKRAVKVVKRAVLPASEATALDAELEIHESEPTAAAFMDAEPSKLPCPPSHRTSPGLAATASRLSTIRGLSRSSALHARKRRDRGNAPPPRGR
jgi:translation initiation factor IF-2